MKQKLVRNAGPLGFFIDGSGFGLLIAYAISTFNHQLPIGVLILSLALMSAGGWLWAFARRYSAHENRANSKPLG